MWRCRKAVRYWFSCRWKQQKSIQSAAGKTARVGLLQTEQRRLNGGQLQTEQPKVNMVLQAGAAVVDCITAGGAVEVNYGTAGKAAKVKD